MLLVRALVLLLILYDSELNGRGWIVSEELGSMGSYMIHPPSSFLRHLG